MADNIGVTPGSGKTIATEDVSDVHHQKVKIEFGGDGEATMVSSSDPLPVDLGSNNDVTLAVLPDTATGDLAAIAAGVGGGLTDTELRATAVPVSGTVTANLSATDNAVLDTIDAVLDTIKTDTGNITTAVQLIDNAISGSEMQVDVVGALPAGANAIGKLAANSGVDIGDVDVTSLPKSIQGPGIPNIDSYTHASINLAAGANQVLVSSAASKQIWVYGIGFTVNVAGTVSFQDEDDTAITGIMNIAATSGMAIPPSGNFSMPIWKLATNKDLEVDIGTSELDGWIDYAIVSV